MRNFIKCLKKPRNPTPKKIFRSIQTNLREWSIISTLITGDVIRTWLLLRSLIPKNSYWVWVKCTNRVSHFFKAREEVDSFLLPYLLQVQDSNRASLLHKNSEMNMLKTKSLQNQLLTASLRFWNLRTNFKAKLLSAWEALLQIRDQLRLLQLHHKKLRIINHLEG